MGFYKDKNVLVTGGTGLIGRPLLESLIDAGAKVTCASLDKPDDLDKRIKFINVDLRDFDNCLNICKGRDLVFNLVGVKGSPKMCKEKPASFYVPTIMFSINMMEAARQAKVERYMFTSSIGVYQPAEIFNEDDVWSTFPSENDRIPGWAKRVGELQAEAYEIQYKWDNISIVRPANVYGPYDNFDPENAMVIPSLIHRASSGERPLTVWGDGSPIRDFIHVVDLANLHILVLKNLINKKKSSILNCGYGKGYTVLEIIKAFDKALKIRLPYRIGKRRSGDLGEVVANVEKIKQKFSWKPRYNDLNAIIKSAYYWEKKNKSNF